jgi:hypothetical protein
VSGDDADESGSDEGQILIAIAVKPSPHGAKGARDENATYTMAGNNRRNVFRNCLVSKAYELGILHGVLLDWLFCGRSQHHCVLYFTGCRAQSKVMNNEFERFGYKTNFLLFQE